MIRITPVVVVVCVLLLFFPTVDAQTITFCPAVTNAYNETACYEKNNACRWDTLKRACVDGAPSTCMDMFMDPTCLSSCDKNPYTGVCETRLPVCSSLITAACQIRPDCTSSGNTCTDTPSSWASLTSRTTCEAAGGFWDPWVTLQGQCYASLQANKLIYPCSRWSYYSNATACAEHACTSVGGICYNYNDAIPAVDGGYQASVTVTYNFMNVHYNSAIPGIEGDVYYSVPDSFQPDNPVHYTFMTGGGSASTRDKFFTPSVCSSYSSKETPLGIPLTPSVYPDKTALFAYFASFLQQHQDLAYEPIGETDPRYLAMRQVVGYRSDSGPIVSNSLGAGLTTFVEHFRINEEVAIANCGIERTHVTGGYKTVFPLNVGARSGASNVASGGMEFTVFKTDNGHITLTGTSDPTKTFEVTNVRLVTSECPAGEGREYWDVPITINQLYDPDRVAGIRSLADIKMSWGSTTITNYVGVEPYAVVPPIAPVNNKATSTVMFRSRCSPITADGLGQFMCQYQNTAARIADSGSDIPCPAGFDGVRDFFMSPKIWSVALGVSDPNAEPAGTDPTGVNPDKVSIFVKAVHLPGVVSTVTPIVEVGMLPSVNSPITDLVVLSDNNGTNIIDLRNHALFAEQDFVALVRLKIPAERGAYTLRVVPSSVRWYPVDVTGTVLYGGLRYVTWSQMSNKLTCSPRTLNEFNAYAYPMCAAVTQPGEDALGAPRYYLESVIPANGYKLTFDWGIAAPPTVANNNFPTSRRLLEAVSDVGVGLVSSTSRHLLQTNSTSDVSGSTSFTFIYVHDPTNTWPDDQVKKSAPVSAGMVAGTAAGSAAVVGGLAILFL